MHPRIDVLTHAYTQYHTHLHFVAATYTAFALRLQSDPAAADTWLWAAIAHTVFAGSRL